MLKNFIGSGSWKYKCVLALGFLAASGGASADPCTTSSCDISYTGAWNIGEQGGAPAEIPAGTWTKNLEATTDGVPGGSKVLTETLVLTQASGIILKTWTETILLDALSGLQLWVWDLTPDVSDGSLLPYDPIFRGSVLAICPIGPPCTGIYPANPLGDLTATLTFDFLPPDFLDPNQDLDGDSSNGIQPQSDIAIFISKKMRCIGTSDEQCRRDIVVVENAAVPEPGTLLLLAGGLAGLAGLRRRRYA